MYGLNQRACDSYLINRDKFRVQLQGGGGIVAGNRIIYTRVYGHGVITLEMIIRTIVNFNGGETRKR